jgi:hypothetical protein
MRRKPTQTFGDDPQATRFAWGAAFFATIALIAILGLARSAQALTVPTTAAIGPTTALAPAAEDDEGEEDDEAESSEEDEAEVEECEEAEESEEGEEAEAGEECAESGDAGSEAPPACLLSRTAATASVNPDSGKLRLTVRYEALSPTTVAIEYRLRGGKGPLRLGDAKKHLGRAGTLHLTETVSERQLPKVLAARDFTVQLRPAGTPRYCQRLLDRHLTIRHAEAGGLTWSDPEASFRR